MKLEVRPNLVDRAVSFLNPAAGLARMAARASLMATATVFGGSGGYRGSNPERGRRRGWFARARSANADVLPGSERMRAEQRDAAMNQPIATAAINRKVTFVVGTGLTVIPALDGKRLGLTPEQQAEWEARLAADYDAYMMSKDPDAERKRTGYGLQAVSARGSYTSGDVLKLRVMPDNQPGRLHLTAWKLVEADRLKNPPQVADGAVDPVSGNMIAGGVEVDANGAAVAYHVLKQHPGDLTLTTIGSTLIPERIEAWDVNLALPRVVHIAHRDRPEQVRGVGMLASVLEPLKMASDLSDAELFAAVMSAMIAVVYKSPGAQPMPEPDYGDGVAEAAPAQAIIDQMPPGPNQYRMEAGSVMEIDSDAEVKIEKPGRPNSDFDPFFKAIVQQIGAAIDIPAGVLMLLFNSSYTASKAELEALYQTVRSERAWFAGDDCDPTYECFVAEKVARGDYAMPGFFSDLTVRAAWLGRDWRGDGKISLNPAQEATGYKIQQDNGWKTGEQITAELTGGSFAENIRKRGAEHRAWVAEGLPVALTPGTPAAQAGGNADGPGGDGKPSKNKDDGE